MVCSSYSTSPTSGSSPRVWGNVQRLKWSSGTLRFIPTRVGKWLYPSPLKPTKPVHPHACGEMAVAPQFSETITGSSPRVWGNASPATGTGAKSRFIPTRVGKCAAAYPVGYHNSVHPHACGEMVHVADQQALTGGSSPRVWGNGLLPTSKRLLPRFIPTRVGKWNCTTTGTWAKTVHPHACGEMNSLPEPAQRLIGSSPRVWGNE